MKTYYSIACCLLFFAGSLNAEKVEIYSCESKHVSINPYAVGVPPTEDDKTVSLDIYYPKERIGIVDLGKLEFSAEFKIASSVNWAEVPFFGSGEHYLLKSMGGDFYIVFFEFREGRKGIRAVRLGLGKAENIGNEELILVGYAYEGISTNEGILKFLTLHTSKQAQK